MVNLKRFDKVFPLTFILLLSTRGVDYLIKIGFREFLITLMKYTAAASDRNAKRAAKSSSARYEWERDFSIPS